MQSIDRNFLLLGNVIPIGFIRYLAFGQRVAEIFPSQRFSNFREPFFAFWPKKSSNSIGFISISDNGIPEAKNLL